MADIFISHKTALDLFFLAQDRGEMNVLHRMRRPEGDPLRKGNLAGDMIGNAEGADSAKDDGRYDGGDAGGIRDWVASGEGYRPGVSRASSHRSD